MSSNSENIRISDIELHWSCQQPDLHEQIEDWRGISDPQTRRKLQNRANQRARRRRQQAFPSKAGHFSAKEGILRIFTKVEAPRNVDTLANAEGSGHASPPRNGCIAAEPRAQDLMHRFAQHALTSFVQGTPSLSHLPLLIKYNVSNALALNSEILGVTTEYLDWNGISSLNIQGPHTPRASPEMMRTWPPSLQPTALQQTTVHHPWVDLFPWARFRDNLLQAFEYPNICDEDDLCRDVCDYGDPERKPTLVVWGSPWDPRSWEVSEAFLIKWGWLLSGCAEIIASTNYWRSLRDEPLMDPEQVVKAMRFSLQKQLTGAAEATEL